MHCDLEREQAREKKTKNGDDADNDRSPKTDRLSQTTAPNLNLCYILLLTLRTADCHPFQDEVLLNRRFTITLDDLIPVNGITISIGRFRTTKMFNG